MSGYRSIFTPKGQLDFSKDFQPGQYAKVNANANKKKKQQQDLLNQQSQQQAKKKQQNSLMGLFGRVAKTVATDVGHASRAAVRPVVDVATGKGGKAVHDTAQLASDVSGGVANDVVNKAKKQAKYLITNRAATGKERQTIIQNQSKAEQAVKSGKVSPKTKQLIKKGGQSAKGTIETQKLIAEGAPDKKVQQQIETDRKAKANLDKKAAGAALSALSVLPAGEAVKAATGTKDVLSAAARSGVEGAAGNEGATLEQHPDASQKELGKAGVEGLVAGVALPVAGELVGRAAKYVKDANKTRVTTEEATQKLKDAGYTPDETKEILQDALPEKGLAMPGSKPRVKLNDESVQKAAANFDEHTAPAEVTTSKARTYNTIHAGGEVKPVQGEPINIVKGVDTFLHKDENGNWVVSEAKTGKSLTSGGYPNQHDAIKAARDNIFTVGEVKFKQAIKDNQLNQTPAEAKGGETTTEGANLTPLQTVEKNPEIGTSKLGTSVREKALQDKIISKTEAETEDLPTYNKANMQEQAQYATELVKNDPQSAIDIALGKKNPPAHILPQMVYNAVEEYARGVGGEDGAKLLLDLSRSKQVTNLTTMGQNIRAAAERDPHSPTNLINEVAVARAQKIKGGVKAVEKSVKADAKAIKKATPAISKDDWENFVNELRC